MNYSSLIRHAVIVLAGTFCALTPTVAQIGGASPHGNPNGSGCDISYCQNYELMPLKYELQQLVSTLPTTTQGLAAYTGTTRDLTNGALAAFIMNGDMTDAEAWINTAFASLDSENNVWGNVGETGSGNDPNSTEFAMLGLGALLSNKNGLQFVNLNSATHAHIKTCLGTLYNHINNTNSGPQLTQNSANMYIMNTVAMMLVAQAIDDQGHVSTYANYVSDAEDQLYAYLYYMHNLGVHEFDSTEYSATQMEALVEGYMYADNTNDQHNFKIGLDYLWMDLAANFFAPNIRLVPPYSRNYDFISGQGATAVWEEVLGGWMTDTQTTQNGPITGSGVLTSGIMDLQGAELLDLLNYNISATAPYTIPLSDYQLAITTGSSANREIFQLWGNPTATGGIIPSTTPTKFTSLYNNLTMGCTSGYYGPQDELFGISMVGSASNVGANRKLTIIRNVLDSTGSPYGTQGQTGGDGSFKPDHIQENPVCAMWSGTTQAAALISTFFNPQKRDPTNNGLWSNILFPLNTANPKDSGYPQILINNQVPSCFSGIANPLTTILTCPLSTGDVVTWEVSNKSGPLTGAGVVGFKLMESTPLLESYYLEIDPNNTTYNEGPTYSTDTARVVVEHTTGTTTYTQQAVSFLFVMDDTATSAAGVYNILENTTFSDANQGTGNNLLSLTFNSNYRPGSGSNILSSLSVTRSNTNLADTGTGTAKLVSGSTPSHTSALTQYSLQTGTETDLATTFWQNNTALAPTGFSCSVPLCVAP